LKVFKTDGKPVVRGRLADSIFHRDMDRAFRMEGVMALKLWLGHVEPDMRHACLLKCKELSLINSENVSILLECVLTLIKDEEVRIRDGILESLFEGGIVGQFVEVELNQLFDILIHVFQNDSDNGVRVLAAKLLLCDVTVDSTSCYKVVETLGIWAEDLNRPDLYHTCILTAMCIPAEYWTSVDLAQHSSTFRHFSLSQNLSVQLVLKLLDNDASTDAVKLSIFRFVLHLGQNRFSLRLLTALLDSENFSRLNDCLKLDEKEVICAGLEVILTCFVPGQTELSNNLTIRVQELIASEESTLSIRRFCADIILKFDLDTTELCKIVAHYENPKLQKVLSERAKTWSERRKRGAKRRVLLLME